MIDKHNWTKDKAVKISREYRQFLLLIAFNKGIMVVPWSQDLDDFWHQHILSTLKYTRDCNDIFGRYIHHDPDTKQVPGKQESAWNDTKHMYKDAYRNHFLAGSAPWEKVVPDAFQDLISPINPIRNVMLGAVAGCGTHPAYSVPPDPSPPPASHSPSSSPVWCASPSHSDSSSHSSSSHSSCSSSSSHSSCSSSSSSDSSSSSSCSSSSSSCGSSCGGGGGCGGS